MRRLLVRAERSSTCRDYLSWNRSVVLLMITVLSLATIRSTRFLFALSSPRVVFRIHEVDDKRRLSKHFNHIAGLVKAKVADLRRHHSVYPHLQLLQLASIEPLTVCDPEGTLE